MHQENKILTLPSPPKGFALCCYQSSVVCFSVIAIFFDRKEKIRL